MRRLTKGFQYKEKASLRNKNEIERQIIKSLVGAKNNKKKVEGKVARLLSHTKIEALANSSNSVLFVLFAIVWASQGLNLTNLITSIFPSALTGVLEGTFANLITGAVSLFQQGKIPEKEITEIAQKLDELSKQNVLIHKEISEYSKDIINLIEENAEISKEIKSTLDSLKENIQSELNLIKEELNITSRTSITTIEKELAKEAKEDAKLFRPDGPHWIDFEKGYVYERKEVKEILSRLKNQNTVIITGKPASGKSVILRNIGYTLAKEKGETVYYVPLKRRKNLTIPDVKKIRHGTIIVDDAHLNIEIANEIYNLYSNIFEEKVKVIIGSREFDFERIKGPTHELRIEEAFENAIKIDPEKSSAAEGIISLFESKVLKDEIDNDTKEELNKDNLWILAWQLDAYQKYGIIDNKKFGETVKNHIKQIANDSPEAEKLLFLLSTFYAFEIPVRETYLKKFIGENYDSTVKQLLKTNEITEETAYPNGKGLTYVSLHHSSIAEIYLNTFLSVDTLEDKASKVFKTAGIKTSPQDTENPRMHLFKDYIKECPAGFENVIEHLDLKYAVHLSELVTENPETVKNIFEELYTIGWKFNRIFIEVLKQNQEVAKKINEISPEVFEEKINKWDNPKSIGYLLEALKEVGYGKLDELLNNIDVKVFEEKIRKWDDPWDIKKLLKTLKKVGY